MPSRASEEPGPPGVRPTRRIRAVVAYDGTDFLGFQRQRRGRTIQGVLEETLETLAGQPIRVLGAGRTDARAHAWGQVIAFDLLWRHSLGELQKALNALLPRSVVVRQVEVAPEGFHPRFDAVSREYRYRVFNNPLRNPFEERFAHQVPEPLDVACMDEAAQHLVGQHDFASFGRPTQGESTVREVRRVSCYRHGDLVIFDMEGNAFLRGMVRSVVGTLLEVGAGWMAPEAVADILEARDRGRAGKTAPAKGLCLMRVNY